MVSAKACLDDLERLTNEQSSDKRHEVLRRVTDLFFVTEERQKDLDTNVFGTVLDHLAYALEAEARRELSERLATARRGPRKLIVRLANDDIDVARPVLENSSTLTNADLVNIASVHGQDHLHAISSREEISSEVTDIILERGEKNVVNHIARNKGANFSHEGFDILSTRSEENHEISEALATREDTPEEILEKAKSHVAKKLKGELTQSNNEIAEREIDEIVNATADLIERESKQAKPSNPAEDRIAALEEIGKLSEETVIRYARTRNVDECIYALARLTKMEPRMIKHCVLEADLAALGILCKASEFSQTTFTALLQLRLHIQGLPSNLAIKEMKRFQGLTLESAQRVMRFLKVRIMTANANQTSLAAHSRAN